MAAKKKTARKPAKRPDRRSHEYKAGQMYILSRMAADVSELGRAVYRADRAGVQRNAKQLLRNLKKLDL